MVATTSKPFNPRAFVALVAAVAGLGLPLTGVANHLFQMESMTLRRHARMAAHNGLAVIFATFVVWHVVLNRRAFLAHLRGAAARWRSVSREVLWATVLVAAGLFVAVGHAFHAQ
jgi:hypothetical protein